MTSYIDHTVWNTRERATSSDHNRSLRLVDRAICEAVAFLASGATKRSGCFGDSFIATPVNGTMKTAITPGLALFVDPTQAYPDSLSVWVESQELREITHDPADPLNRIDVVEMRPGTITSSTQARDVFSPITGAFTVQNLAKEIRSYPEFRIVKGTPSATPSAPAGSAGWMPLSYVPIPGGVVTLLDTQVVYCRPILAAQDPVGAWSTPSPTRHATRVKGGGVEALGASLNAAVAVETTGRFPGYYVDFRLDAGATLKVTSMTWDGGGLPLADGPVYFYAVPPPYPAGYDASLAGRELWTPNIHNLYTQGGYYSSGSQEGCLIVASATAPTITHPAGYATGNGQFNLTWFSAVASPSDRANWVYLGAASFELAGVQLVIQRHSSGRTATQRKPRKDFFTALPIVAPTQYVLWSEEAGDPVVRWPITARKIDMHLRVEALVNGWLHFEGFDTLANDTTDSGMVAGSFTNATGGNAYIGTMALAELDTLGRFTIKAASQAGCVTAHLVAKSYEDAVLRLR